MYIFASVKICKSQNKFHIFGAQLLTCRAWTFSVFWVITGANNQSVFLSFEACRPLCAQWRQSTAGWPHLLFPTLTPNYDITSLHNFATWEHSSFSVMSSRQLTVFPEDGCEQTLNPQLAGSGPTAGLCCNTQILSQGGGITTVEVIHFSICLCHLRPIK